MSETDDGFITGGLPPGTGEVLPENLGMHTSLPTQVGVVKTPRWRLINPINSLTNARTIEFQVSSHHSDLIDPGRTYLYLVCKVTDEEGKPIPKKLNNAANPKHNVIPVNGLSYCLFKSCEVRLNDQPIHGGDSLYAYKGDFESRLMWPKNVKKGMMRIMGFDEELYAFETVGKDGVPDFDATAFTEYDGANHKAFQRRAKKASEGKEFSCLGKIHSEIFDQSRLLPPGSRLHVTFHRTDFDSFSVLCNDGQPKIAIVKAQLMVLDVPVDPDIVIEMAGETAKGRNTIIPLRRVEMNYYTKMNNTTDFSHPNLFHDGETLPRRIFIAFVDGRAFRGHTKRDPFNYLDIGIAHYALKIGGEFVPYPEIQVGANEKTLQFFTLLDATGTAFDEDELGINIDNYKHRNNFLAFDLTNSKTRAGASYELPCTKSCDLEITLRNALTDPVTMIVYAEYDAELEINQLGQVKKKQFGSAA